MKLLVALLIVLVAGCATHNAEGVSALDRGDLNAAEQRFMEGVRRGDPMSINNMGVVYERRGDLNAAIQHYTLAARWGVGIAQQNLARLGQTVPTTDLAEQRSRQNAADTANTMLLMRALQPPPPPAMPSPSVNCTSYRAGNTVQTNCF
jgi:Flp pilus assembly protein TadD